MLLIVIPPMYEYPYEYLRPLYPQHQLLHLSSRWIQPVDGLGVPWPAIHALFPVPGPSAHVASINTCSLYRSIHL